MPPCSSALFASLDANMARKKPVLEVVNSSGLTDADWVQINKVIRAYERGGWDAFWTELETLGDDLILKITVVGAFFPDAIREAIEDELAESGLALEDLREYLEKNEVLATEHQYPPYRPVKSMPTVVVVKLTLRCSVFMRTHTSRMFAFARKPDVAFALRNVPLAAQGGHRSRAAALSMTHQSDKFLRHAKKGRVHELQVDCWCFGNRRRAGVYAGSSA